jgi:hypothetical protein
MEDDALVRESLSVMLASRRLHMIALTALNRRLELLKVKDTKLALAILTQANKAFQPNAAGFTIVDLESDVKGVVIPYFELLVTMEMFIRPAPTDETQQAEGNENVKTETAALCRDHDSSPAEVAGTNDRPSEPGRPPEGSSEGVGG